jgi:hypothetical protein
MLCVIGIIEVFDSDKKLESGASKFSLFNEFSFSMHIDSSCRRGLRVHIMLREKEKGN